MRNRFTLDHVLAVGVDPHRESLDVAGICFPEEIILDETFDNTPAGHRALSSKARELATEHQLTLGGKLGLKNEGDGPYLLLRGFQKLLACVNTLAVFKHYGQVDALLQLLDAL